MTKEKLELSDFDAADYLNTAEARAEYLRLSYKSGDKAEFLEALDTIARSIGITNVAKAAGVGRNSLYKSIKPTARPEFETVGKILAGLGLELDFKPINKAKNNAAHA